MLRNLKCRRVGNESYGSLIVVVLVPLLLFWRLIFAGEVLYWGVPLTQFYPWHTLINQALAAGHLPLWTDLLGNGAPLMANHQTALFYPPNLLFRVLPVERALGYSVVLHVIGAGLAATYWGRTLGLGWLGRTVLALSYALGGYVIGRTQFITMVAAYAWLPLLLALTEQLARRRRAVDAAWLGGALALQFLAGHAQIWFYSLLLVGMYGLYRLAEATRQAASLRRYDAKPPSRQDATGLRSGITMLVLALVLGLGLSAVQLLPTAELAANSQRGGGAGWDFAMTYSYWPWRLLTLLAPNLFGSPALGNYAGYATYWEDHAYIGVLPLIFVLVALASWIRHIVARNATVAPELVARRIAADYKSAASGGVPRCLPDLQLGGRSASDSVVPFFGLLLPVAAVLAMGSNTPVFPLIFRYVPGFGLFQAPARLMIWFAIGASTLAGTGADRFRLTYRRQYTLRLSAAGAAAMLAVAMVMEKGGVVPAHVYAPAVTWLAVLLGLACLLLLLRGREPDDPDTRVATARLPRSAWQILVVSLICADLVVAGAPLTPTISPALYHSPPVQLPGTTTNQSAEASGTEVQARLHVDPEFQYDLSFNEYFRFKSFGPSDVAYWQGLRDSLLPNLNILDGIPSTGNNEPLVIGRWRTLLERTRHADWPTVHRLLQLMNVGFLLTKRPGIDLLPVDSVPHLYRLAGSLPRAWVVPTARVIADPDLLLHRLIGPEFDPRKEVLLEAHDSARGPGTSPVQLPGTTAEVYQVESPVSLREGWNSRTIDLTAPWPGYLVLAYTYYPGWRAAVDNRPAQILNADYAFMAVPVESGSRQVVLTYQPASFVWGAAVSAFSVLAIIMIVSVPRLRNYVRSK
jgi:hypothetical protein